MSGRVPFDKARYESRVRSGGCFVCAFLRGDPGFEHELLYDDGVSQSPDGAARLGAAIRTVLSELSVPNQEDRDDDGHRGHG